jgi:ABC-type transport system involved in multi-copper enzyme maturation permease subunit
MLLEIFRFELRQQLKSPLFWIISLAYGAVAFLVTSSDAITLGGASGNVLRNAPMVIARVLAFLSVISMFLVTAFVATAALRDFDMRTSELVFTTPVSRGAYLGGRFLAGYVAALAVMLVCALGIALGSVMPWIDPVRLGPFSLSGYGWGLGVIVIPDMLLIAALLFALATATRSLLATYIGVIAFFVLFIVSGRLTQDVNNHTVAALLDPFGIRTVVLATRYWSADQFNHQLPPLDGLLLFNRLIWIGVALAMFAASFWLFRANREGVQLPQRKKKRGEPPILRAQHAAELSLPKVELRDDARAHRAQLGKLFVFDTMSVLTGVPFLIMLALGLANLIPSLIFTGQIYGTPT